MTVIKPDYTEFSALAHLELSHFNIKDPSVSMDRRWRVTVVLPDRGKKEIPIGSTIWVSEKFGATLVPTRKRGQAFNRIQTAF